MSEMVKNIDPQNPFGDSAPKIVHMEKNESHYECCRMQMHEIEHTHRRTFIANLFLCLLVSFLSVFSVYVKGFSFFSVMFIGVDRMSVTNARLGGGIFQIVAAMIIIIIGYFAWANFRSLNIILMVWYGLVTAFGIFGGDYISAVIGVIGLSFYIISMQALRREGALEQMEGYPEFREKFDINKSDYVLQTLLAHRGEHHERPSFFTGKTSLRKKKKKQLSEEEDAMRAEMKTDALAAELAKQIAATKDAEAAERAVKEVELLTKDQLAPAKSSDTPAEMQDVTTEK